MSDKYLEAEKRLAELLGWTSGKGSMGKTEWRNTEFPFYRRGDTPIAWCRDWSDCGPLMVVHEIRIVWTGTTVIIEDTKGRTLAISLYCYHPDKDTAVRYAIVMAVIAKLESKS